jgi:DNA repair exonuclease SbcCD ATPase subunit|tara:strand:+ start:103 stop:1818 length:1716 start_codon:yes stop_codon:yes gene_type:complete
MIEFQKVRWKNFLSTGNHFTEITLNRSASTLIVGENGAGKSTILDALTFSLFGKSFRKINKPQLVNSVNSKDCVIEIEFKIGKVGYLVRRGIKPNIFEIYINGKMLDQDSKIRDSQLYLEENILKLNYKSFTQTVILGSATFVPFMQLSANDRRDIIEDILDIKIFSSMNELLKGKSAIVKDALYNNEKERELQNYKIEMQDRSIGDAKNLKKNSIKTFKSKIKTQKVEQKELLESNTTLADTVNALIEEVVDETKITTKKRKMDKLENQLSNNSVKIDSEIDWFKTNDVCPSCQQDINDGHKNCIVEEKGKKKDELTDAIASLNEEMLAVRAKLDIINKKKETLYDTKNIMHNNVVKIDFIQKNIDGLEADIDDTENNNTNVKKLEKELKELNAELKSLDTVRGELVDDKNYFTVAGQFLKDTGVKTSIIKYYLPIMNKLINRYLQEMDFYINFTMDERFVENIKSRGREGFTYSSFSEGEKMRVDLALLFTWREIARMKNSVNTNLLVLDEVFDSSLDATGTDEFLKLLNTLGGNNVFVISHKGDILFDKFNETVKFQKVKNFSQIAVE